MPPQLNQQDTEQSRNQKLGSTRCFVNPGGFLEFDLNRAEPNFM